MNSKQIARRLIQMVIVLIGISFITFALIYMAPGDPVRAMYSSSGVIPSEEVMNQTREAMGLNKPFIVQYFDWLTSCLHGDFGTSYSSGKPVIGILMDRLIPTLKLAFLSLIIMLIVAVPSGILAAVKQNKLICRLFSKGNNFLGSFYTKLLGWVNAFIFCCIKAKSFTCSFDRWGNKKYDFTRNNFSVCNGS